MSENKKYFWLKLKENFFDSDEIIILEGMEDGIIYCNILLKMYLKSLKNGGKLMFKEHIPYNLIMLAKVTRNQVGTVEKAINIFKELGLVEILDNGAIYMNDIQNYIGKTTSEAERKKIYREKISLEKETLLGHCPTNDGTLLDKRTPEIEIELDKEKNIKKAENKKTASTIPQIPTNQNEEIIAYYNQHSTIKAKLTDKTINNNLTKILKEHTINDVKLVIKYILNNKWHIENGYTGLTHITRPTKFSNKLETAQIALKSITIERLELKSKPIFTEFA